jgi:predicted XRE-type DNA-binding protein
MWVMNWPELLQDLRAADMTQAQIAAFVGVNQSSISDLARGLTKRPSFEIGERLSKLHKRVQRRAKSKARA